MATSLSIRSLAARNLVRKPVRTGVLVLSIALLVLALVFVLSFVRRVDSAVRKASSRLGADIIVVPSGSRSAAEDVLLENSTKSFYMDRSIIDKIRGIEGIEDVTPQTYLVSITGECCDIPDTVVVAFDQDTDFIIKPWLGKAIGRRLRQGEAIVGNESAMNISVGLTEVNSKLFGTMFRMIGVLEKTGTGLDTAIFIDDANRAAMTGKIKKGWPLQNQISLVFVKVRKGLDPRLVAAKVEDSFIEVDAVARKDIGKGILATLRDLNRIFLAAMLIAAALALSLVWAVYSAIANERAWEVGIMRALGASQSHISRLFLTEVIVIAGIGSIIGALAGTALSVMLTKQFLLLKNASADLGLLERAVIGLVSLGVGILVCTAGALAPIQRLKKIEPLLAIKQV